MVTFLTATRDPPTWNRYASALLAWRSFARAAETPFLPADPAAFALFLATAGQRERGYTQTKRRVCAITAFSELAGVPSPGTDADVTAVRAGARRLKTARRGQARPIFQSEIPRAADAAAAGVGTVRHPRARHPYIPALAYAFAARFSAILADGALRFDDAAESELGDFLHFPDVVQLSVFATKTDKRKEGQLAILPVSSDPHSGCAALLDGVRDGLRRLLTLPPELLRNLGRTAAGHLRERYGNPLPGPSAMATWPADVGGLAATLYALDVPVHGLPTCGRWLVDELGPTSDLLERNAQRIGYKEFVKVARGVLERAGANVDGFGAHSFRRGIAAELALRRMAKPDIAAVLRHRSLASTQTYILPSAQASILALTRREADAHGGRYPPHGPRGGRAVHPRAPRRHRDLGQHPLHRAAGTGERH